MKRAPLSILAVAATLLGCAPMPKPPVIPKAAPAVVAALPPAPPAAEIVSLRADTANRFLRADARGEILVRLHLGAKAMKDGKRPPVNVALVVDTSGSMEGDAIRDARAASLTLLDGLAEGDRLAVISFNSETEVLVPSTRLDKDTRARVREQIGAMKAQGTTDLAGGLRAGLDQLTQGAVQGFQAAGVSRVVLLGDGVPNDEAAVLPLADEAARHGTPITMLGLGLDYNETLMSAVAQRSGGKYHFVRDSTKVASVFQDEVLRLERVVARAAVVRLKPGPGVVVKEVFGLPASTANGATSVALGDLSEGEERDVVVRLAVTGHRAGSLVESLDAELGFEAVTAGGQRVAERSFVGARSSADAQELAGGRDVDVERAAARVAVAAKIVQAIALARAGNLHDAQATLDQAQLDARAAARQLDDAELREKEQSIDLLRASLPSLQPTAAPLVTPSPIDHAPHREAMAPPSTPQRAPSPMDAAVVMETQAAAVQTIQGR